MANTFRVAIGRCSCRDTKLRSRRSLEAVCDDVEARIDKLKLLSRDQLMAFPCEEEESAWINRKRVDYMTYREPLDNQGNLIVVQAFVSTFRWPTYISFSGVGHIVAEGIVVSPEGKIEDAPDELLWAFR